MAARSRKVALTDDWKANIKATQLVNRLYGHALGQAEMTRTQIDAAKVVLAKILPDLKSMDLDVQGSLDVSLVALERLNGKRG